MNIEDTLRQALNNPGPDDPTNAGREQWIRDSIADTFRGRARFLTVITWIKMGMFLALAVIAAWQFFHVDSTRGMIGWATAFLLGAVSMAGMFHFYWLDLNRHALLREIKRLEVAIARLGAQRA
jgi:hypothetical protein